MQYMGGKHYLAPRIAPILNELRQEGQPYWEPFVGALNVASRIGPGLNLFSDAHPELIALLQAVVDGWTPPTTITEEQYQQLKEGHGPPHLRAFVGFGCSFGGRYFEGYARGNVGNYAGAAARGLQAKVERLAPTPHFFTADFLTCELPQQAQGKPLLIYCDPPYAGTKRYSGLPEFDHAAFWERCRDLGAQGHTVVVSEFEAPGDFTQIAAWPKTRDLRANGSKRMVERLFRYDPHGRLTPRASAQLPLWRRYDGKKEQQTAAPAQ